MNYVPFHKVTIVLWNISAISYVIDVSINILLGFFLKKNNGHRLDLDGWEKRLSCWLFTESASHSSWHLTDIEKNCMLNEQTHSSRCSHIISCQQD